MTFREPAKVRGEFQLYFLRRVHTYRVSINHLSLIPLSVTEVREVPAYSTSLLIFSSAMAKPGGKSRHHNPEQRDSGASGPVRKPGQRLAWINQLWASLTRHPEPFQWLPRTPNTSTRYLFKYPQPSIFPRSFCSAHFSTSLYLMISVVLIDPVTAPCLLIRLLW